MPLRDPQQLTNGVGIRLMKAWSSDFSATSIPLMRCRLYGEVCTGRRLLGRSDRGWAKRRAREAELRATSCSCQPRPAPTHLGVRYDPSRSPVACPLDGRPDREGPVAKQHLLRLLLVVLVLGALVALITALVAGVQRLERLFEGSG